MNVPAYEYDGELKAIVDAEAIEALLATPPPGGAALDAI
ncbi:MAG: hypothetical protein PWP67_2728, partial [Clostridium butyricum]|nr:hypothetical protein [Clostridium butyricum]